MKIGFYAPLKSPDHPVPSGDRRIARLLDALLRNIGHEVIILSSLRSWEGKGGSEVQHEIKQAAEQELDRLECAGDLQKLDMILVYHVYHKAPDWIGVTISRRYHLPYVVVEASFTPSQAGGRWAAGHEQTKICVQAADAVICLNPVDLPCIQEILPQSASVHCLSPFSAQTAISIKPLNRRSVVNTYKQLNIDSVWLICVAMMRPGDKYRSFQELAAVLSEMVEAEWNLVVIGDGEMRCAVEELYADVKDRCVFTGQLSQTEITQWEKLCDVYVWPSINEAFGLALLEAVGNGLPVLAYDYGGVSTIIEQGFNGYAVSFNSRTMFSNCLQSLVCDRHVREQMGHNARLKYLRDHDFEIASQRIAEILDAVILNREITVRNPEPVS